MSNDIAFPALLACREARYAQWINVYGLRLSQHDFFGNQAPNGWRLLYPVSRKAGYIDPIFYGGEPPENWIVVRRNFIIAPPAGLAIESRFL